MRHFFKRLLFIICISNPNILLSAPELQDVLLGSYLAPHEVADGVAILPQPPTSSSIQFQNDIDIYQKYKEIRNTPRGIQAKDDASLTEEGISKAFSEAFGLTINKTNTPEIYKLLEGIIVDAGSIATLKAKIHFKKLRPYALFNEHTCTIKDEPFLGTDRSYPSGHTALGWAIALILVEVNPNRQNEILKRGFEFGQSRAICGYHWQSDVDAGRIIGAATVAKLHTVDKFVQQLKKAKEEFNAKK